MPLSCKMIKDILDARCSWSHCKGTIQFDQGNLVELSGENMPEIH
jgi:hypothetical protein